ncbi:MAG: hypothetical protein QME64_03960 [bacterium]|nr:hypothetical protein [bacterium]
MFRHILLGFFWDSYDNLGHILFANLIWFFCNLPGLFLIYLIFQLSPGISLLWLLLFIPVLIFSATTTGLFAYTKLMLEAKDTAIKYYFLGIKEFWRKGTLLVIIHLLIFVLVIVNIIFYLPLRGSMQMVGAILAGIAFWCGVFVALQSLYAFAILVQYNLNIRKTLKRSFLLLLDNLLTTIGVFIFFIIFLVFSLLSGLGPILFMMSCIAMLGNNALYEIMTKYEKKPEPEHALAPGEKPTSWKQILDQEKAKQKPKWRHDNRGWKDIFRPWDYK